MRFMKQFTAFILSLALLLSLAACDTPHNEPAPTEAAPNSVYTVTVRTAGGMALPNVDVYIYADSSLTDLVQYGKTNDEGILALSMAESDSYAITLSGLADGYAPDAFYSFTGGVADITVTSSLITGESLSGAILGLGDVVSLVERAQEQFDEEEAKKLQRKLARNQFDFNDFLTQIEQIKKMGNIKDLMAMIPGVGKAVKDLDIDDNAFKGVEAIIRSMTPKERANPDIINNSRKERIARGSGTTMQEVNRLMKQFEQIRKTMKSVAGGKMGNLMNMMPKFKR